MKWHEINRKESVALFKSKVQTKVLAECEVSKNIMEDKNISPCHKVRLWQCILLNEVCRLSLTLRPLLVYLKHGPQLNSKSTLKILALETFFRSRYIEGWQSQLTFSNALDRASGALDQSANQLHCRADILLLFQWVVK